MASRDYIYALGVGMLLLGGLVSADKAPTSTTVTVNITSQPLGDALNEFAQQSGLQVVFYSNIEAGLTSPGVSGTLSPQAALQQLLANTPLSYEFVNARTVAIRERVPVKRSATDDTSNAQLRLAEAAPSDNATAARLPQSEEGSSTGSLDARTPRTYAPEILVKGSRILNMDIRRTADDVQPYVVFDRETIARSGAQNVEDFLRFRLTAASSPQTQAQTDGGTSQSSFDLRGLGTRQTLILIDGHRIASKSVQGSVEQPDINGIPLSAIERIEVLPTTASSIYGGGATGGVINVILRRDYTGLETKLTYANSLDGGGGERRIDVSSGFSLEGGKTNVLLAGSYSEAAELLVRDRDFVQRGRAFILENNRSAYFDPFVAPPLGYTTNIRSDAPLLPGGERPSLTLKPEFGGGVLNSPYTFVPVNYVGPSSDSGAGLINNAGQYNFGLANTVQEGGGKQALLNSPTVESIMGTVRRELTPRLHAFLDLSKTKNDASFATNSVISQFTLPASAPSNPFNEDILITTPAFGTDRTATALYRDTRAVAGIIFKLSDNWQAEADYTWNRSEFSREQYGSATLTSGAGAAIESGSLNVFRDTNVFPVDFASFFAGRPVVATPARNTMKDAAVRLSGPLLGSLPGGAPSISLLMERREESLDDVVQTNPNFFLGPFITSYYDRSQSIDSAYAEIQVPVVSGQNRVPGVHLLELMVAGRHDNYHITSASAPFAVPGFLDLTPRTEFNQDLSSTDPTVGFRYQPMADVTLRASYGTGFLPPSMMELVPGPTATQIGFGLVDPRRGGEELGVITIPQDGNPNLQPERSESWSAGLIFTPRFAAGLRLSLDWTKIEKEDNITRVALSQDAINNEANLPGIVIRGAVDGLSCSPVCPIIGFNNAAINAASQTVEAYDFALDYRMETSRWGAFNLSTNATRNVRNELQVSPISAVLDSVGLYGGLKWQVSALLGWDYRQWAFNWTTQYLDSYFIFSDRTTVSLNQGAASIPSQTYHHVSALYRFDSVASSAWLTNTEVQFGIRNVFNTQPPIDVNYSRHYRSTYGDPRLSSYFISLRKSF